MAIYIEWTEEQMEFDRWNYVGNGYTDAIFKPVTIKKSVLYSRENSNTMIEKAKNYIKTDMADRPNAKVVRR